MLQRYRVFATLLIAAVLTTAARADDHHGTAEEAKVMVGQAISYFDAEGAEAAFARFNDDPAPMFRDGDLYIFVLSVGGEIVAHAADPSLVGRDAASFVDADGKHFADEMIEAAGMDGAWVDYKWLDPTTDKVEPKSSWVVLHDGYVFGCGIYQP